MILNARSSADPRDRCASQLAIEKRNNCLIDVACAGWNPRRGVSAARAAWRGAARAPGAAIWCARPLPIPH